MNIKKFKYYKLIKKTMEIENEKRLRENRLLEKKDRVSGSDKLLVLQTMKVINEYMNILARGDEDDKLLLKQLKFEKEYMRTKEKNELSDLIRKKLGKPTVGGSYNLAEIGRVIGVTRERVRQIEASGMKILKHPGVGRAIKYYMEDTQ